MSSLKTLPPIATDHNAPPELSRQKSRTHKWWKQKYKERASEKVIQRTKELVTEDVYLMDSRTKRLSANLLANSLTARLRKNLPEGIIENDTIKKIRRDSLKDFVHLDNLQRQFNSEMQRENSRLDKETYQLLKRQKQLQKQSEMQRRKHDKLSSSLRSRSDLSSASLPPLSIDDGYQSGEPKETFPEFAKVDKDDQTHVKVFKMKGIYQPMNKYHSRIEPFETSAKDNDGKKESIADHGSTTRTYESVNPIDLCPPTSRTTKKNLRVSWSRQSKYYADAPRLDTARTEGQSTYMDRSENPSPDQGHKGPRRTFNSRLSMRSDTYLIQNAKSFKGRRKVETIGLQWKIPPKAPTHPVPELNPNIKPTKEANPGLSHNLNPVTTALAKEGLSTKKVCWQVQKPQLLTQMETYRSWLRKLEMLKGRESEESSLHSIPDRTHLSVLSQVAY